MQLGEYEGFVLEFYTVIFVGEIMVFTASCHNNLLNVSFPVKPIEIVSFFYNFRFFPYAHLID